MEKAWMDSTLGEYDSSTTATREVSRAIKEGEMTKDEALKLALEALEEAWYHVGTFQPTEKAIDLYDDARTAIKEALAQPEQEPVAWKLVPIEPTNEMLKAMDECSTEGYDERLYAGHAASIYMAAVDVALTPPQRKPLTDEEIFSCENSVPDETVTDRDWCIYFARAIEAAHGIKGEA